MIDSDDNHLHFSQSSFITMLSILVAGLAMASTVAAQNFQNLPPASAPVRRGKTIIVPLPKDASGEDVYPDCNRGKVCLPEGNLSIVKLLGPGLDPGLGT